MRFTIRDLLWLTVAVAFCLGWWIQQRDALRQQNQYRENVAALVADLEITRAKMELLQDELHDVRTDERAVREQLAEFVATQDDKARIDVAPGLFHRVAAPK